MSPATEGKTMHLHQRRREILALEIIKFKKVRFKFILKIKWLLLNFFNVLKMALNKSIIWTLCSKK
jgi:hypothetical protein